MLEIELNPDFVALVALLICVICLRLAWWLGGVSRSMTDAEARSWKGIVPVLSGMTFMLGVSGGIVALGLFTGFTLW